MVSEGSPLAVHAINPRGEPWSLPLPAEFGREHAARAWGGDDNFKLSSISRQHMKLVPDGPGAALLTCFGQRVRVRNLPGGGEPTVLKHGEPPLKIFAGSIIDLTLRSGPAGESADELIARLAANPHIERYASLELRAHATPEPATSSSDAPPPTKRPRLEGQPSSSSADAGDGQPGGGQPHHAGDGQPPGEAADYDERAIIERLLNALPKPERRLKEPDPQLLFSAHHVPPIAPGLLRVVTFNILNDLRVAVGAGGLHAVWDVRRIK